MMGPVTETELRELFPQLLDRALAGEGIAYDTGMDEQTRDALNDVARAYPNAGAGLIAVAQTEFERQLDGTHVLYPNNTT